MAPRSLAQNERLGSLIATAAGLPEAATVAQLRALPVDRLLAVQEEVDVPDLDDDSFIWLQAVVDGLVLTDTPARLLVRGEIDRAPLVIGVNSRELGLHRGRPAAEATVSKEFGASATEALALYGLGSGSESIDDPRLGDMAAQLATDLTFRCPTVAVSQALTRVGVPVWQYQFDYAPPDGTVSHSSEIGYVFNQPKPTQPPLQGYWVNFVKTGDPNGVDRALPHWPHYSVVDEDYMAFEQAGPSGRRHLRSEICRLRDVP